MNTFRPEDSISFKPEVALEVLAGPEYNIDISGGITNAVRSTFLVDTVTFVVAGKAITIFANEDHVLAFVAGSSVYHMDGTTYSMSARSIADRIMGIDTFTRADNVVVMTSKSMQKDKLCIHESGARVVPRRTGRVYITTNTNNLNVNYADRGITISGYDSNSSRDLIVMLNAIASLD